VGESVKVVDFGLSKELGSSQARRTASGIILGTVEYVSPEGTTGESELVDFYSDQWALAVVTYRMLSGKLPFTGANMPALLASIRKDQPTPLRVHVPELPEHVESAIARAMAKEKCDRFESVQDFVRALSGLPTLGQSLGSAADGGRSLRAGRRPARDAASQQGLAPSAAGASSGSAPKSPVAIGESGALVSKDAPPQRPRIILIAVLAVVVLVVMIVAGMSVRRIVDSPPRPAPSAAP
jgi:serine/threonine protein kinase